MKIEFKKIIAILAILGVFIVFSSSHIGNNEGSGYATVSIYENFSVVNSMIVIAYPDETTEVVDLGPFKYHTDYLQENIKTLTRTLNMMREKGFKVVSTSSSGKINSNKAMRITTIIMEN